MCSVGDDFENEGEKHMPSISQNTLSNGKCNKCREESPIIVLRHKDAYCKNCFITGTNHKFKAVLGKSKLIRPNDRVMVSYEVGHASTALMHFLRSGLDLNTPKKLRFEPIIFFIEDQYHLTITERQEMINKIVRETEHLKFQIHLVSFADSVTNDDIVIAQGNLNLNENDDEQVNRIFNKSANKTTRKEIRNIIKRKILITAAKKLGCKYIFTPELSVDIASNLLTNVSLGKGSQICMDTGFCDDRDSDVKILRPLRTFDMKELAFYNVLHDLEPVFVRQPEINIYSSVHVLTKHFISDLQENYPATIATVVRTGDKLALDKSKVVGKCTLCEGALLTKATELDSEESTNFSKLVSSELPDLNLPRQERYKRIKQKFDNQFQKRTEYCFSCARIFEYLLEDVCC